MGARSSHWIAPLTLIAAGAAFATIDACDGMQKGGPPPPRETGNPTPSSEAGGQTECAPKADAAPSDATDDHASESDAAPSGSCTSETCACQPPLVVCGGACVDLTFDPANCGACGNACTAGCAMSLCLPVQQVLAAGQKGPADIAVDGTSVYWTNSGDGTVMKVPLNGGATTTLASAQGSPRSIAVNATNVFFTTVYPLLDNRVMTLPIAGGAPVELASGLPDLWDVAADAANVYVAATSAVLEIPMAGGSATILGAASSAEGVAVDATNVYWTDYGNSLVASAPLGSGSMVGSLIDGGTLDSLDLGALVAPPHVLALFGGPLSIVVDSTSAYWTGPQGSVAKVPLAGGDLTFLSSGEGLPSDIAVDATNVYWTSSMHTVNKVPLGGGTITTIAENGDPGGIAVDATSIYWTDGSDGSVRKVAK